VTYYKGDNGIYAITPGDPIAVVESEDFGSPGPVIDFQAPLSHTLVTANIRKKGRFEQMLLDGRPPIGVGITRGGAFYVGTAVIFTVLRGYQRLGLFVGSVQHYRLISMSYLHRSRRLQWAAQAFSQTQLFYGLDPRLIADL